MNVSGNNSMMGFQSEVEARRAANSFKLGREDGAFVKQLGDNVDTARGNLREALASGDEWKIIKAKDELQARQRALTLFSELSDSLHQMIMRIISKIGGA